MSTKTPEKPFTVVVGVDYSELSALALIEAVTAARSREHNHVHIVHSMPIVNVPSPLGVSYVPSAVDTTKAAEELQKFVEEVLGKAQDKFRDGRAIAERLTTHVRISDAREAIVQLASDVDADLVVIGTHGRRGVSRLLMGSVAESVVRTAPCPVLVARPRGTHTSEVIRLDPPCPQCVETRRASDGKDFWCIQHREHHDRRHTYHFGAARAGHQSGFLIPLFK